MKKFLVCLLTVLLAFNLAGCNTPTEKEAEEKEVATVTVVETAVDSTSRTGVKIPTYYTLPADVDEAAAVVVMIHGHHGNHNEWGGYDKVANTVAENGIIVATLDFAGCGASTEDYQNNAMSYMCADVVDVINDAKKTYKVSKVGAMGYSMGGRIVCQMLIEELTAIDSVVFVAPAVSLNDMIVMFNGQEYYDMMKDTIKGTDEMYPFPGAFGEQLLSNKFFEDLEKYGEDMATLAAAKYAGNSLTIYSTDDFIVNPAVSQACAEAFNSTVITVNNLGHSYSFYGEDPATVNCLNTAISSFFINDLAPKAE